MKVVCITNDVEATTIQGEAYREDVAANIVQESIPQLLVLYKRYGIKATFFCQGSMIEKYPEIVNMIQQDGHEVACHGWVHESSQAFDLLTYDEQVNHLRKSKILLDSLSSSPVVSFRAPALRVNDYTARALRDTGFTHDSSVAPQRLDAFMSLGSRKKLLWINAPRGVYETSEKLLARSGESGITEVPLSAFALPYISALMRISPFLTRMTRRFLYWETKRNNNKVICFLLHPGEDTNILSKSYPLVRRSKNPIAHFLSGVLRAKLKRHNLGAPCIELFEEQIRFWKDHGYVFKTVKEL